MNILKAVNLRKIYGQGETEVRALDGINLEVEKGEFVAIVGTSGSGKSTMLHMIGGLDTPTSGQVIVDGQNLSHMTDEELTIFRRRNIGFVFQQYNLVPMLNVWENIILPVKLDGKKVEKGYVDEIIDTLGIRTKLENLPSALSGGQQQRVAIARALAAKPAILLADEPTGNLDSKTSQDVLGLLKVTSKRFHQTIVMITHNEEIAQMADWILQIEDGKIVSDSYMVKVENKETLRLLTKRFMKMNRARNIIAVIAIMLTSLLFTSLFVGSVSMILSKRATEIKQFMDSSHAIAQNLSEEDAERLQKTIEQDEDVERYGSGIFLGAGMDERFGFSVEVRYADENMAESFNCLPTTGRLPEKENEVALSSTVLEAMGVTPKIGEEVTLTWEVNPMLKQYKTDTFQICGFWQGDKAVLGQMVWVSEAYAKENRYPVTQEELENGIYNGGKEYSVWYKNLWNLEKKTEKISKAAGFTKAGTGMEVNPAYNLFEEDSFSFSSLIIMILFVILAGYLIIYNIFNISVKTDIRAYGLLKNVGTTGKQLKKIVRMQAWRLSAIGIPIGLLCGYLAGLCMAPSLTADAQISAQAGKTAQTVVSANPLIFFAAALLTLLTVYLSSLQACKMVERVSPVEALRLAEGEQSHRKIKKNTSVTWWGMAVQNVLRNWKKGLIVMLSIALSMVVVNCIVMLVQGYDFDSFRKVFLASDFQLDQMTGSLSNTNFNGITPEIKEILNKCPESEKTGYVYYSEERHKMEPALLKTWETLAEKNKENWTDYEKQIWEETKADNTVKVHFLGISEAVFDMLEWKGEKCSWNTFKSGDYVIVDYSDKYTEEPVSYYQSGETFKMEYGNGKQKDYGVIGEAMMPYSLDYPYADSVYITVMVPEEEYITQTENQSAMYAAIDAKKGEDKQVKEYIDKNVLKENDMINVFSVLDMKASFRRFVSKYYMIGSFLVVILAFIGIMNFFNTTATSVISRKKELALLEVVGMTKKQISKMLIAEGFIYLGGAFVIAIVLVVFGAEKILSNTFATAFFFQLHLTIVPCLLMVPILSGIAYAIPKYQFKKMSQESVVERIRNE